MTCIRTRSRGYLCGLLQFGGHECQAETVRPGQRLRQRAQAFAELVRCDVAYGLGRQLELAQQIRDG